MGKKTISILASLLCLVPTALLAQVTDPQKQYTAFDMRSNGKIYVLTACILVIMIGLIVYMVRLDRKITRLEKESK